MSFFKRLLGISEKNQGEVLTRVSDQTWTSTTGRVINQVSPNLAVSSDGVTYTRTGSNIVNGTDGSLYMSMDDPHTTRGHSHSGSSFGDNSLGSHFARTSDIHRAGQHGSGDAFGRTRSLLDDDSDW